MKSRRYYRTRRSAGGIDEAPYAAVKWRRGRDQAPLVWRPEGAPSTSKFQVATRWVSTNGVNSPVRNLATMHSYARWSRVQMNDPNPDARPRRVKPEELMELLMQLPEVVFGSSLHRESLVENGYRAVVDARAGRRRRRSARSRPRGARRDADARSSRRRG